MDRTGRRMSRRWDGSRRSDPRERWSGAEVEGDLDLDEIHVGSLVTGPLLPEPVECVGDLVTLVILQSKAPLDPPPLVPVRPWTFAPAVDDCVSGPRAESPGRRATPQ